MGQQSKVVIMIDTLTHFEFLTVAGALIGFWLKHQSDYAALKARVRTLESDNGELKANIKQLLEDLQEIKLLLAKNNVQ